LRKPSRSLQLNSFSNRTKRKAGAGERKEKACIFRY
jgi:hypothetical protein